MTSALEKVQQVFSDPNAYKRESVQTLWSGYGEIARYYVPKLQKNVIVKEIAFQHTNAHPRGWNSSFSHQRKLSSYHNEHQFYRYLASSCDEHCKVPTLFFHEQNEQNMCLVMQDLNELGYTGRYTEAQHALVSLGIKWLANFHARFLAPDQAKNVTKVWPIGTYWHFKTRPDEYESMHKSPLKTYAQAIDAQLNKATYQTLLHGDAKLANFCFSSNSIGAVDFQYTGKGAGIKDLIYFLGSCFDSDELAIYADTYTQEYFEQLRQAIVRINASLGKHQSGPDFEAIKAQWQWLIPFAWADFERFLAGWAPSHLKRHDYSAHQTQVAIDLLINNSGLKA